MNVEKPTYGGMRRFRLDRKKDDTGVSGTGCVAQGVVFSDGTTVLRWLSDKNVTTVVHDSIYSVEEIHCHDGNTEIRWEDPICFNCWVTTIRFDSTECDQCGATWEGLPYNGLGLKFSDPTSEDIEWARQAVNRLLHEPRLCEHCHSTHDPTILCNGKGE